MTNNIYVEKYRPQKLEECILPTRTKKLLIDLVAKRVLPNMLFVGPPGIGKTTAARSMMEALGADCIFVNASLEGNIDTIRTRVQRHASTCSLNGERKYVVFEEVDKMTIAAQAALRAMIEEYTSNCGYIFIGNNINLLDDAIISRLDKISFDFPAEERGKLAQQAFALIRRILVEENVAFDEKDIKHFLVNYLKYSTDLRQMLIKVENYSSSGTFDLQIEVISSVRMQNLVDVLRSKKVKDIRTWAGENSDLDPNAVFTFLYENVDLIATPTGVAAMIAHVAEHQYWHSFVANPEINIAALLLDIASECVG